MLEHRESEGWINANERLWDARVASHLESTWYDTEGFRNGKLALDMIEREGLGDVSGKSLLHLQCHFGLSSLSWSRLGADVCGVDFSAEAVKAARLLAEQEGLSAEFVCSDVLQLDLKRAFDCVTTSWGVLCWLPDLRPWAVTIARHLRPGGRFFLAETHPVAWIWDDAEGTTSFRPRYPYFQGVDPLVATQAGTYVNPAVHIDLHEYTWNHPLSTVISALATAGLQITDMQEYPLTPWRALPWMERDQQSGWWRLPGDPLPLSFSIGATKPFV
jgi:2-polyprenyl-3-methyl-5-hydroxy-6-metoxy-1,4-benzoquinol methylase